jgi:hypothetical protein
MAYDNNKLNKTAQDPASAFLLWVQYMFLCGGAHPLPPPHDRRDKESYRFPLRMWRARGNGVTAKSQIEKRRPRRDHDDDDDVRKTKAIG